MWLEDAFILMNVCLLRVSVHDTYTHSSTIYVSVTYRRMLLYIYIVHPLKGIYLYKYMKLH